MAHLSLEASDGVVVRKRKAGAHTIACPRRVPNFEERWQVIDTSIKNSTTADGKDGSPLKENTSALILADFTR
jgi:hypothetical protein